MTVAKVAFTAAAGEHYVLFRLHAAGLMAALAPRNAPSVDVIVLSPDEEVTVEVQVKTTAATLRGGWGTLNIKDETRARPGLYYALVNIRDPAQPVAYILPSEVVADVLPKQHVAYHKRPRLRGDKNKPKKDNEMRSIRDDFGFVVPGYPPGWMEPYREAWHLLAE
jgi:hypothetical protein